MTCLLKLTIGFENGGMRPKVSAVSVLLDFWWCVAGCSYERRMLVNCLGYSLELRRHPWTVRTFAMHAGMLYSGMYGNYVVIIFVSS